MQIVGQYLVDKMREGIVERLKFLGFSYWLIVLIIFRWRDFDSIGAFDSEHDSKVVRDIEFH